MHRYFRHLRLLLALLLPPRMQILVGEPLAWSPTEDIVAVCAGTAQMMAAVNASSSSKWRSAGPGWLRHRGRSP
jgi:hypothetical protein